MKPRTLKQKTGVLKAISTKWLKKHNQKILLEPSEVYLKHKKV